MINLLKVLLGVSMASPTVAPLVNDNNLIVNKSTDKYFDYAMKLTTSNFEVDQNNELLDNKVYDMKDEFQNELNQWVEYKKENNIELFELEHIETKFGALDSSGHLVSKNIYYLILESNDVTVQSLEFKVYDRQNSQYKISFVGDFIIDGAIWKDVSLVGYDENQYFTSSQIMSDFFITSFYKQFEMKQFVTESKVDVSLENNQIINLDDLMQSYIDYFRQNPQQYRSIETIFFSLNDLQGGRDSLVMANDLLELDIFTYDNKKTDLEVKLTEGVEDSLNPNINIDFEIDSQLQDEQSHVKLNGSHINYNQYEFKSNNFKITLNVLVEKN
ncbi:hypothetical protein [Spiroplasma endosymbiont of Diplazon laetatorius]|uniref:hypothetical protein n=1 Tax=Spiroplasma endosymbiont of Diplazon laetatorius TaxID=3066322 RepID=UPI0030D4EAE1